MISCGAITGGIASGKSMLEQQLTLHGCRILDADAVVHALQAPGGTAFDDLVRLFGTTILTPEGEIDRQKLAAVVFFDTEKRTLLERLIHGKVREAFQAWRQGMPDGVIHLASIPLLYEAGWERDWPFVVAVCATPEVQLERLISKRGMTETEARARIAAQLPVHEKAARADYVIWNNSDDPEALRHEADRLFLYLMENENDRRN